MFASFLITFREGLEAFLLVGIILSYLTKLNHKSYAKYIYLGVVAGIISSLVIAFILQVALSQFENARYQNYMMIFILLFASIILTYMAIWMQKQAKSQNNRIKINIEANISTGNLWGMIALSYIAVLREGVETILFFSALLYSDQGIDLKHGLIGAFSGLLLSLIIVLLMVKWSKYMPISNFFQWTGLLVIIIAAGLLSSAINMMQAANIIPIFIEQIYNITHILDDRATIGIFLRAIFGFNSSPTLLQFITWALYLVIFISIWNKNYATEKKL